MWSKASMPCLVTSHHIRFVFWTIGIFFKQKSGTFYVIGPNVVDECRQDVHLFHFLMRPTYWYRHHRAIKIHLSFLICGMYRVERREPARCGLWSTWWFSAYKSAGLSPMWNQVINRNSRPWHFFIGCHLEEERGYRGGRLVKIEKQDVAHKRPYLHHRNTNG